MRESDAAIADEMRRAAHSALQSAEANFNDKTGWSLAADSWRKVTGTDSALPQDWMRYAEALARSGNQQRALLLLAGIEQRFPHLRIDCAIARADALENLGRHAEAEKAWRIASTARAAPGYWANFGLARSLSAQRRGEEARAAMLAAFKCDSSQDKNKSGLSFAASLDVKAGDMPAAETKFDELNFTPEQRIDFILAAQPGMSRPAERKTLFELARAASGLGQFVDLGCFLGSLTVPLAMGLRLNQVALASGVRVHAFDLFRWDSRFMDPLHSGPKLTGGDNFESVYRQRIASYQDFVSVQAGNLLDRRWSGGPIEILAIDVMKTPPLAIHVCQTFYPHLIPGRSYVLHQDFCHFLTWWIHLIQYLARDHFEVVDPMPNSGSVLFRCTSPIDAAAIQRLVNRDMGDPVLAEEAFKYSRSIVAADDLHTVEAAHARWHLERGKRATAKSLLEGYLARCPNSPDLLAVKAELAGYR
jgi:tetratricopeptide (TPR) repeat protein